MRRRFLLGVATAAPALLMACSTPSGTVARYDLGLPPPASTAAATDPQLASVLTLADVSAPAWLDSPAIFYRLAYEDTDRAQSYAQSQWVAAPASLLSQRLRERLSRALSSGLAYPGENLASEYLLRVELDEFSQVFDTPQSSHVLLRARATFIDSRRHELVAQRAFELRYPAPSPDALGAVRGLRRAVDDFITELLNWMAVTAAHRDAPKPSA